jgi:hypothetical protein
MVAWTYIKPLPRSWKDVLYFLGDTLSKPGLDEQPVRPNNLATPTLKTIRV